MKLGIKIKKLHPDAELPYEGSAGAAGYDLKANLPKGTSRLINPGQTEMIPTGLAVAIPEGYFGMIVPRSGLATKKGLRPANTPGTIN